ncbi:MAG: hypothetical protein JWP14_503 [Frankiales bacterium]|jgi:hypothetical protein|nr:hypothetical protein [Frankiales bacterium]
MRFFEDEPARAARSGADWEHHRKARQPHAGPAQDEVGVLAMSGFSLARSPDVAVALSGITAFSDGLLLHVVVLFADEQKREQLDWSLQEYSRSPGRFRLGVQLPDGRRATTGTTDAPPLQTSEADAVLTMLSSTTGPLRWQGDYWLWPLPNPGTLVVGCRWPDRAIDETLVSVEAGPLRSAAASSGPVWRS